MSDNRTRGSETGRDFPWWVGGGALFVIAAVIFLAAGSTGFAIAFFAIGGAMIVLAPSLP